MTGADTSRAWRELGAAALAHNVSVLRGALPPGCELMAVVKADAFGHGMSAVRASPAPFISPMIFSNSANIVWRKQVVR